MLPFHNLLIVFKNFRAFIELPAINIGFRTDPPTHLRIIITAGYIVEPCLGIIDIPAVAEGVEIAQRVRHGASGSQRIAPCVIGVRHHLRAATLTEVYHAEFARHTSVDRIDSRY